MRPFCCLHCDVGWSAYGPESNCFECGRPGYTNHITPREHENMSPLGWNMLFGSAERDRKESER